MLITLTADDSLPPWLLPIVIACANEGLPVAATARVVKFPFDDVMSTLRDAKARGQIVDIPPADWPATAKQADRLPSTTRSQQDDDFAFKCRQMFRLTALEAGFLVALLRHERVEKHKLHNIVEQHRATRATQPNNRDATDPKMVDVMICKLRKKLKSIDDGFLITTIWGGGYHVQPDARTKIMEYVNATPESAPEIPPVGGPQSDVAAALSLPA